MINFLKFSLLLIVPLHVNAGWFGLFESGPSDEKVMLDINNNCLKASDGFLGCKSEILQREQVTKDIVKFNVKSQFVRTEKKPL